MLIDAALVIGWVLMVDWLVYQVGSFFSWGLLFVLSGVLACSLSVASYQ